MNKGRLIKKQFENNNYIRLANSSNHWVDFSYKKLQGFINNFGNDFNLVIYWFNGDSVSFYSIPYIFLKKILVKKYIDGRGRWVFSVSEDHILHFHKGGETFNIKSYLNHSKFKVEGYPVTEKQRERILFANIGWMISYRGQSISDKISGGGSYSDVDKHEAFNFKDLNGKCYGYLQPASDCIDLQRIDSSLQHDEESLDDVTVVWFATNPVVGGSWIVGWYKHATVFRECQKSKASQRNGYGYYAMADLCDCTLLPVDERVMQIPRQIKNYPGRSNIWYADAKEIEPFKAEILDYINAYKPKLKKHHNTFSGVSSEARAKIEQAAIKAVCNLYEGRGYQIEDVQSQNYGWDLEATNGKHRLYLEVKGQGNHEPYVRISRNEYEQMSKHKDKYRLCVVMDSLNEADIYVFLPQDEGKWVCEDDDSIELIINEQVAAIATF